MAKKRYNFSKVKRAYSGAKRGVRRYYSKDNLGKQIFQPDAMIYGAVRPHISNMMQPLTQKIPLGQYADNIVMAGVCWLASKFGKGVPMLSGIARKGLVIENAIVGGEISQQFLPSSGSGGTNSQMSNWVNNY